MKIEARPEGNGETLLVLKEIYCNTVLETDEGN
jgi:hypothetical protein